MIAVSLYKIEEIYRTWYSCHFYSRHFLPATRNHFRKCVYLGSHPNRCLYLRSLESGTIMNPSDKRRR